MRVSKISFHGSQIFQHLLCSKSSTFTKFKYGCFELKTCDQHDRCYLFVALVKFYCIQTTNFLLSVLTGESLSDKFTVNSKLYQCIHLYPGICTWSLISSLWVQIISCFSFNNKGPLRSQADKYKISLKQHIQKSLCCGNWKDHFQGINTP